MGKTKLKEAYSEVQRRRNRRSTLEYAKNVVETLKPCGISPVSLSFKDSEGRSIQVDFQGGDSSVEEECSVERALFIKDKFNISRRAYHELAQSCRILPSQSLLSKQVKELNKSFEIMEIDGKYTGVYQSITKRLTAILGDYVRQPEKQHLFSEKKVRVKISGDGTKIGKRMHVLNFVFSVVGENSCAGEKGSYLVSIVKAPEKYLPLKEALGKIIQEVNSLDKILLGNESYSVEFYLGGDLKFLNLVLGIDGFGATYSCLWCKCPAKQRYDTGKTWSMIDIENGARTLSDIEKCSKQRSNKFNCSHPPLFNVPVVRVVPDTLHLFLRIADQLVNHIITELRKRDNLSASSVAYSFEKCSNMSRFEEFVKNIGIEWQFYVNKESKKITCRDFTGREHWKIFTEINLDEIIPGHPKLEQIKGIWCNFVMLMNLLKGPLTTEEISLFHEKAILWLNNFNLVYMTSNVTPYMHVLIHHVHETNSTWEPDAFFTARIRKVK